MSSPLPPLITEFLETASLDDKHQLLAVLSENIACIEADNLLPPPNYTVPAGGKKRSDAPLALDDLSFSRYVQHIDNLGIDATLSTGVETELASMKLLSRATKAKKAKIKTQWLSPSDDHYNYGSIVNKPLPISNYPSILKLMELVNVHPSTTADMDSCLISCFSTHKACLSLHNDNEELIAQDSSICTVSFGAPRTLEFVCNNKGDRKGTRDITADLSLPATHHSMNVMHPGCQSTLKHRIPAGVHVVGASNVRYSISFRKIVPQAAEDTPTFSVSSPSIAKAHSGPSSTEPSCPQPKTSVVLMAGDSFLERLDTSRLAKGKKKVYNIAKGGSKMHVVLKSIEDFVVNNPTLEVSKLFVSIGTNDIRNCSNGIGHLKSPTCEFMKMVKELLPTTKIFIQSLIPIPSNGCPHTESNVINMNHMLYNLCSRYKLFYIDMFRAFFNHHGYRDETLFPAFDAKKQRSDIHPNAKGKGVMARIYIYRIHSRWFNPMGY